MSDKERMAKIDKAASEAKRFLAAVKDLKERAREDAFINVFWGCKESGALRRASLDLTRALADMRRW